MLNYFQDSVNIPSGSTYQIGGVPIQLFPATTVTVGTGGQYLTVGAAIAAGQTSLLLVSNVTETGDITVSAATALTSFNRANNWNLAGYKVTGSGMNIRNLTITESATSGTGSLPGGTYLSYCTVVCTGANARDWIGYSVIDNCRITLPNANVRIIECSVSNCTIVGGGASCGQVIYNLQAYLTVSNVVFSGTFATDSARFSTGSDLTFQAVVFRIRMSTDGGTMVNCVGSNLSFTCSGYSYLTNCKLNTIYSTASVELHLSNCSLQSISGTNAWTGLIKIDSCTFAAAQTFADASPAISISNSQFNGNVTVNSDYLSMIGCKVGGPASGSIDLTIGATAEKCVLVGNTTKNAIIDGGTSTEMIANNVF